MLCATLKGLKSAIAHSSSGGYTTTRGFYASGLHHMYNGVYFILCVETSRSYIGQSGLMKQRWANHRTLLRSGKHYNKQMQADWDRFGEDSFVFRVTDECRNEKERLTLEQFRLEQ